MGQEQESGNRPFRVCGVHVTSLKCLALGLLQNRLYLRSIVLDSYKSALLHQEYYTRLLTLFIDLLGP